jgi:hypothetical protein
MCQIDRGDHVRAIGWLSVAAPYTKGAVDAESLAQMEEYARRWGDSTNALGWPAAGGFHECEFCNASRASGNFGVPGNGLLYACPQMIAHYVRDHGYRPPLEFLEAIRTAPLPGTREYEQRVAPFVRCPPSHQSGIRTDKPK